MRNTNTVVQTTEKHASPISDEVNLCLKKMLFIMGTLPRLLTNDDNPDHPYSDDNSSHNDTPSLTSMRKCGRL